MTRGRVKSGLGATAKLVRVPRDRNEVQASTASVTTGRRRSDAFPTGIPRNTVLVGINDARSTNGSMTPGLAVPLVLAMM
jgi:hypothetical protein